MNAKALGIIFGLTSGLHPDDPVLFVGCSEIAVIFAAFRIRQRAIKLYLSDPDKPNERYAIKGLHSYWITHGAQRLLNDEKLRKSINTVCERFASCVMDVCIPGLEPLELSIEPISLVTNACPLCGRRYMFAINARRCEATHPTRKPRAQTKYEASDLVECWDELNA